MQQQLQIAKEASLRLSHDRDNNESDIPDADDDSPDVVDELMQGTSPSSPIIVP